jgi:hypothetical protein
MAAGGVRSRLRRRREQYAKDGFGSPSNGSVANIHLDKTYSKYIIYPFPESNPPMNLLPLGLCEDVVGRSLAELDRQNIGLPYIIPKGPPPARQTPLERQEEGQAHWDVVSTLIHLPRIMFNNACEKCRTTKTINDFGATRCVVTFYSVGGFSIQLSNYNDITSDL